MKRLMYITFMLTLLILLSSCAKPKELHQDRSVDASFIAYVNEFKAQAGSRGLTLDDSTLVVSFGDVSKQGKDVVAFCSHRALGPSVTVDKATWDSIDVVYREEIMFHELGHCLLGLQHDNDEELWINYNTGVPLQNNLVPSSLMNAVMLQGGVYMQNRQVLLDRLFLSKYDGVDSKLYVGAPIQFNWTLY